MNKFTAVALYSGLKTSAIKKGGTERAKWERPQLIQQKRCWGEMELQEQWGKGRKWRVQQRKVYTARHQKVYLYKTVTSSEGVDRWGVSSTNFPVQRNFLLYTTCCLTCFRFFFFFWLFLRLQSEAVKKENWNWSSNRVRMWKGSEVVLPFKS